MVIYATNQTKVSEVDAMLKQKSSYSKHVPANMGVPFNAKKFEGMLQKGIDGVSFQKEIRNEWN